MTISPYYRISPPFETAAQKRTDSQIDNPRYKPPETQTEKQACRKSDQHIEQETYRESDGDTDRQRDNFQYRKTLQDRQEEQQNEETGWDPEGNEPKISRVSNGKIR